MKYLILLSVFASASAHASDCSYGGIQEALRNSADRLASGNPVRYTDFANNAPFSEALARMEEKGVSPSRVERTWAEAINDICNSDVTAEQVGPSQTLDGLASLLGISN